MPLFKSLKAPNASATLNISKETYALGETITGTLVITSQEQFQADEIRIELQGNESLRAGGEAIRGVPETQETRLYSTTAPTTQTGTARQYTMHRGQTRLAQKLALANGFNQQYQFSITIPNGLGPTFQGLRRDGQRLERTWELKGIIAIGGRPDVETKKPIQVTITPPQTPTPTMPNPSPIPVPTFPTSTPPTMEPAQTAINTPPPKKEIPTTCTRCGAPTNPSQEDLIVTCRYCGFTIAVATSEEIKTHSMLENHLFTQQAVEAAQRYMDKGIFRSGVSRDAQITNVKLRYIPFWTFPVNTQTHYTGITGAGLSGEFHQVEAALTDKRASKLSKLANSSKQAQAHTSKCSRKTENQHQYPCHSHPTTFGRYSQERQ